jgi:hypothetical protein
MTVRTLFNRFALLGVALAVASCSDTATQPGVSNISARSASANGSTALGFNGADASTSTPGGTIVTTQIDDIAYDVMVRPDGPNANGDGQMIVYNGHSGVTGWGILVLGPSDGVADGTVTILAGGIVVAFTPLVLTQGSWQHLRAERRAGNVTVTLDDQTFDVGFIPVNPLAGGFADIEQTSVGASGPFDGPFGGFFHGAIDRVRIQNLTDDSWIERWNLNERSGATATGVNGNVLHLGTTVWTPRGQG